MPQYFSGRVEAMCSNNNAKNSPPYHVAQDDVSTPLHRLEAYKITGHQSVRGWGEDVRDTMYGTPPPIAGTGNRPPALSPPAIALLGRHSGTLNQHRQTESSFHRMRIGAAQRKPSRGNGDRSLALTYGRVPRGDWLRRLSTTVLVNCAHFWLKGDRHLFKADIIRAS